MLCRQIEKLELEPHLNTCFRHFILFTLVRTARAHTMWAGKGKATPDSEQLLLLMCLPSPRPCPTPQEFNLIDERELAPLRELIDRMVR